MSPTAHLKQPFTRRLLAVTVLALVGRIAYVWFVKRNDTDLFLEGDAFFYSTVAHHLAEGKFFVNPFDGYPAADHPPLTILVLGPAAFIAQDSVMSQRLTMALIGALVVFVVGLIGRKVAGDRAGLLAAVAAAVYPNLWVNDGLIMSESISALTTAVLVLAGFRLAEAPTLKRALVAGGCCGLAVLARAEVGLLLPFMIWPILVLAKGVPWKDRLVRMAGASVATILVIAPWTIWNLTQYEKPVLISTNDGTVLLGSYCDATFPDGDLVAGWSLDCVLESLDKGVDPSVNAARQRSEGIDYATSHLSELPELVFLREGRTFGWFRPDEATFMNQGEGRERWISWWCWWTFWLAAPIAVAGAAVLRRRGVTLWPFAATLICTVVVSGAFYGLPRFRLPLEVSIAVLVGVAADALWRRVRPADDTVTADEPPAPDPDGASSDTGAIEAPSATR